MVGWGTGRGDLLGVEEGGRGRRAEWEGPAATAAGSWDPAKGLLARSDQQTSTKAGACSASRSGIEIGCQHQRSSKDHP